MKHSHALHPLANIPLGVPSPGSTCTSHQRDDTWSSRSSSPLHGHLIIGWGLSFLDGNPPTNQSTINQCVSVCESIKGKSLEQQQQKKVTYHPHRSVNFRTDIAVHLLHHTSAGYLPFGHGAGRCNAADELAKLAKGFVPEPRDGHPVDRPKPKKGLPAAVVVVVNH